MNKVLIIEDDQIVANIYRNKFSVDGFQVEVANDGEKGLEAIRAFRPHVIILDLMLPKISGVELMKSIRAESEFKDTPIIVFSNTYLTNLVQEAWKAGATKCLSKANCTPKQVIAVVRSVLAGNGAPGATAAPAAPAHTPPQKTAPAPAPAQDADAQFQADLLQSFLASLPSTLTALRTQIQGLIKAGDEEARLKHLNEMYRRIHALTGNAGIAGLLQIAHMADALEALLKELYEKPAQINASTLRTVASAIDFLGILFQHGAAPDKQQQHPAPSVLVVDDEPISRRAITYALQKAKLKCSAVEDPLVAHDLLLNRKFDLVFLDVDMPNMNGYELCTKLRSLPSHKKTPVVFVTSLNDFESRANSTMSGGNDFIAKPFLFIELAVKALLHLMRSRLTAAR